MTMNAAKTAPAEMPLPRISLTQLIAALSTLGINVESPLEEIEREMQVAAVQAGVLSTNEASTDGATVAEETPNVPVFSAGLINSPWSNTGISASASATTVTGGGDVVGIISSTPVPTTTTATTALTAALIASGPMATAPNANSVAATNVPTTSAGPSTGSAPTVNGFVCAVCQSYNLLKPASETWYTVVAGRNVGVFKGWHSVQSLVSGVPHASYKKYSSEDAAHAAFQDAMDQGIVVVIN